MRVDVKLGLWGGRETVEADEAPLHGAIRATLDERHLEGGEGVEVRPYDGLDVDVGERRAASLSVTADREHGMGGGGWGAEVRRVVVEAGNDREELSVHDRVAEREPPPPRSVTRVDVHIDAIASPDARSVCEDVRVVGVVRVGRGEAAVAVDVELVARRAGRAVALHERRHVGHLVVHVGERLHALSDVGVVVHAAGGEQDEQGHEQGAHEVRPFRLSNRPYGSCFHETKRSLHGSA